MKKVTVFANFLPLLEALLQKFVCALRLTEFALAQIYPTIDRDFASHSIRRRHLETVRLLSPSVPIALFRPYDPTRKNILFFRKFRFVYSDQLAHEFLRQKIPSTRLEGSLLLLV